MSCATGLVSVLEQRFLLGVKLFSGEDALFEHGGVALKLLGGVVESGGSGGRAGVGAAEGVVEIEGGEEEGAGAREGAGQLLFEDGLGLEGEDDQEDGGGKEEEGGDDVKALSCFHLGATAGGEGHEEGDVLVEQAESGDDEVGEEKRRGEHLGVEALAQGAAHDPEAIGKVKAHGEAGEGDELGGGFAGVGLGALEEVDLAHGGIPWVAGDGVGLWRSERAEHEGAVSLLNHEVAIVVAPESEIRVFFGVDRDAVGSGLGDAVAARDQGNAAIEVEGHRLFLDVPAHGRDLEFEHLGGGGDVALRCVGFLESDGVGGGGLMVELPIAGDVEVAAAGREEESAEAEGEDLGEGLRFVHLGVFGVWGWAC